MLACDSLYSTGRRSDSTEGHQADENAMTVKTIVRQNRTEVVTTVSYDDAVASSQDHLAVYLDKLYQVCDLEGFDDAVYQGTRNSNRVHLLHTDLRTRRASRFG